MGPTDLEKVLDIHPFVPLRVTLSSGDKFKLLTRSQVSMDGFMLTVEDTGITGVAHLRIISIPNIAMIEPLSESAAGNRLKGLDR